MKEAIRAAESAPRIVLEGLGLEEAVESKRVLEDAGARIVVKLRDYVSSEAGLPTP